MLSILYFTICSLLLTVSSQKDDVYNLLDVTEHIPSSEYEIVIGMDNYPAFKFLNTTPKVHIDKTSLNNIHLSPPFMINTIFKMNIETSSCIVTITDTTQIKLAICFTPVNVNITKITLECTDESGKEAKVDTYYNLQKERWTKLLVHVDEDKVSFYVDCVITEIVDQTVAAVEFTSKLEVNLGHSSISTKDNFLGFVIQEIKIFPHADQSKVNDLCEDHKLPASFLGLADDDDSVVEGQSGFDLGAPIPGPQGPPGPQGERGLPGPKGDQGQCQCSESVISSLIKTMPQLRGTPGEKGQRGEAGEPGLPGAQGTQNVIKAPGDKGETGPVGPPGLPGDRGEKGEKGQQGSKGEKGDGGHKGSEGPRGERGYTGESGRDGKPGSPGTHGSTGEKGEKGETGDKGSIGPSGLSLLLDSPEALDPKMVEKLRDRLNEIGLKGEKGDIGLPGPKGFDGKDGLKGEHGHKGSAGSKGEQGEIGASGNLPSVASTAIKGNKGEKGHAGKTGPRGLIGHTGKRGPPGVNGSKGSKGDSGSPGMMGTKGNQGSAGLKGEKGDSSQNVNTEMFKGEKGDTGAPGNDGRPGPIGPQGICEGKIGIPGPPGPPGVPGVSVIGPKGEPGGIVSQNMFYSYTDNKFKDTGNPNDEDDVYSASTMIYRTTTALIKRTSTTPLGTLAYVLREKTLLLRVENGWQFVMMGSLLPLNVVPQETKEPHIQTSTALPHSGRMRQKSTGRADRNYITLAALNMPYSGIMHSHLNRTGRNAVNHECMHESRSYYKSGGTFAAFLASQIEDLKSLVKTKRDRELPVVNVHKEILFDSWTSMFDGSGAILPMSAANIYSFNGKNVMIDQTWPEKAIWHGGDTYGNRNQKAFCDQWQSEDPRRYGAGSSLHSYQLLEEKLYSCDKKLVVLCVEVTSSNKRQRSRRRNQIPAS